LTIDELIALCQPIGCSGSRRDPLGELRLDSRKIVARDLFIALRGRTTDGHDYIHQALKNGAAVIISEEPAVETVSEALQLQVSSTRELVGPLAQAFLDYPARRLKTIGVMGTNGKTTVTTLVWQLLNEMGVQAGLLGTVVKQIGEQRIESRLTTPDPVELASDMKAMVDTGCETVAMEVSSHALDQHRTNGVEWTVAGFTNLTHDHLDYHGQMADYISAKRKLFQSLRPEAVAVINADDPHADEMVRDCKAAITRFSFEERGEIPCRLIHSGPDGLTIQVGKTEIRSPLAGRFNAYNVAETWLICRSLGYDGERLANGLSRCNGAPGRLEKVTLEQEIGLKPTVFVDYAHTPDALANVASTLRELKQQEQPLVILFGCGGDRDRAKRPVMAGVAEQWADRIVVTSDNPRSEDPLQIIRDIERGFSAKATWESLPARQEAIAHAIHSSPANAIVLIAGKGHETYQEIHGTRHPFDDRDVARNALMKYQTRINTGRND